MKLRYKILNGFGAVIVLGIATLMITVSHDSACPAATAPEAGADSILAVRNRCYGVPQGVRLERVAKPVPGDG